MPVRYAGWPEFTTRTGCARTMAGGCREAERRAMPRVRELRRGQLRHGRRQSFDGGEQWTSDTSA